MSRRYPWGVYQLGNGDVYVMPILDSGVHEAGNPKCVCKPKVEVIGARLVITHNAFDKRHISELIEAAINEVTDED